MSRPRRIVRLFTPQEDSVIASCFGLGETDRQIAQRLGRTQTEISGRRRRLGLFRKAGMPGQGGDYPSRSKVKWTQECLDAFISHYIKGANDKEIAEAINRTPKAIRNKRCELKMPSNQIGRPRRRVKQEVAAAGLRRLMYVSAEGEVLDPMRVPPERLAGGRFCGFIISGSEKKAI